MIFIFAGIIFLSLGATALICWLVLWKKKKPFKSAQVVSIVFFALTVLCFMLMPICCLIAEISSEKSLESYFSPTYTQNESNFYSKPQPVLVPVEKILVNEEKNISSSSTLYYIPV